MMTSVIIKNNFILPATVLSPDIAYLALASGAAAINDRAMLRTLIDEALSYGLPSEKLYEAFLQLYLFAGFPAALEAHAALHAVLRERDMESPAVGYETYNIPLFAERGEHLCRQIYTTAYDKMRSRVGALSPDMDMWMIVEGYGKTLSRPGLPPRTRELLVVAVLGLLGWQTQLYSHIRGALNAGATREECEAILLLNREVFQASTSDEAFHTLQSVFG
jgi:4-carboxymuconolactone decarboxylase